MPLFGFWKRRHQHSPPQYAPAASPNISRPYSYTNPYDYRAYHSRATQTHPSRRSTAVVETMPSSIPSTHHHHHHHHRHDHRDHKDYRRHEHRPHRPPKQLSAKQMSRAGSVDIFKSGHNNYVIVTFSGGDGYHSRLFSSNGFSEAMGRGGSVPVPRHYHPTYWRP